MQARHSVISLAALARCIRWSSVLNNMSAPASRSFLYQAVAKISVLVRRLWIGLVFDELPLIAQPLGLGRLCVALVVRVCPPTKSDLARTSGARADGKLRDARARRDPAALASPMAVANGEHTRRIAPSGIIRF